MAKKLQNIKAIKEMLSGTHKTQTKIQMGYTGERVNREEGDIWEENGKKWTIKNGIKKSVNKLGNYMDQFDFSNCYQDSCNITQYNMTDLDKKMSSFHGMCFNCATKMKTKMMLDGTWEAYEQERVKKNAIAWLNDAENDVLEIKKAMTKTEFVNSNGSVEKWSLDKKEEKIIDEIDTQWSKYKSDFQNKFGITDEDLRSN